MCGPKLKPVDWRTEQIASDLLDPLGTATAPPVTADEAREHARRKEGER